MLPISAIGSGASDGPGPTGPAGYALHQLRSGLHARQTGQPKASSDSQDTQDPHESQATGVQPAVSEVAKTGAQPDVIQAAKALPPSQTSDFTRALAALQVGDVSTARQIYEKLRIDAGPDLSPYLAQIAAQLRSRELQQNTHTGPYQKQQQKLPDPGTLVNRAV